MEMWKRRALGVNRGGERSELTGGGGGGDLSRKFKAGEEQYLDYLEGEKGDSHPLLTDIVQMTSNDLERIQRLRQEFQQALREDEPWATNGTEAAGPRPLTLDPPSQPQLPQDDGFTQSSLPR
uniref:Uncharacterized protein n=1 Tax=Knipowitschia caucasica TaxID=637954 RepID=A0AAV2LE07_KNICA